MLIWYITGAGAALAIAWLAAVLHLSGHAPLGLISLGVGASLGAILAAIAASQRLAGLAGRHLLIGTALLATLAVLAQHAWLYRDFRRQWHEARANSAAVALFRSELPWSPAEYFAHELTPERAALWALDAVLMIAAAIAVVTLWQRRSQ